ncbi:unnamed protein product [Albugo candida]|uniref:Uncharacterized protein n=1 Tax=Albugo candida TaxID=65357 RepID=A0A024FUU0_9STRA|nr:unnamed protein product [Albugo candida]|eukprot:CCI10687.1 unnamed protein product [Albugo candida]
MAGFLELFVQVSTSQEVDYKDFDVAVRVGRLGSNSIIHRLERVYTICNDLYTSIRKAIHISLPEKRFVFSVTSEIICVQLPFIRLVYQSISGLRHMLDRKRMPRRRIMRL